MSEECRVFFFPILLVFPDPEKKYQFLVVTEYECAPPDRFRVSDLHDAVVETVRPLADRFKIASDSTMSVEIHEVRRVLLHPS